MHNEEHYPTTLTRTAKQCHNQGSRLSNVAMPHDTEALAAPCSCLQARHPLSSSLRMHSRPPASASDAARGRNSAHNGKPWPRGKSPPWPFSNTGEDVTGGKRSMVHVFVLSFGSMPACCWKKAVCVGTTLCIPAM